MDEKKFARWGLLGGAVFAILIVAAGFLAGKPPDLADPDRKILLFFVDNKDTIRIGSYLFGLAGVAFLWFLGSLFGRLRRAEGDAGRLSGVALTGGVVAIAINSVAAAVYGYGALHPESAAGNFRFASMLYGYLAFAAAVFTVGVAVVLWTKSVLPKWMGYVGEALAPGMVRRRRVGRDREQDRRHDRVRRVPPVGDLGAAAERDALPHSRDASVNSLSLAQPSGGARPVGREGLGTGAVHRGTAFHVAAATAANTASDAVRAAAPGSSTIVTVDRRRRLGPDHAERTDREVEHVTRFVIDGQPFAQHPAQRHVRRTDAVGAEHHFIERVPRGDAHIHPLQRASGVVHVHPRRPARLPVRSRTCRAAPRRPAVPIRSSRDRARLGERAFEQHRALLGETARARAAC